MSDRTNGDHLPGRNSPRPRIVICGAGLGGLGAAIALGRRGHEVTVLEGAAQLSEIGAGIQIPPNSSRVLESYGLVEKLREQVAWPRNIALRRYATGKPLDLTPLDPHLTNVYGHPYWLIHRADYQRILFDQAVSLGVKVLLSSRVVSLDQETPSVTVTNGQTFTADVIVGADGIRSKIRDLVFPDAHIAPNVTAECAYRATVTAEIMNADLETANLMRDVNATAWIGPGRHIMAYPIRQGAMYNLIMCHPGQVKAGDWNVASDVEQMRETYAGFDPVVQRVLSKVTKCSRWLLADLPPLQSWVSESRRVVLIGDAAHATVPFLAQGASMAIEDGACLAECLARVKTVSDIPRYLEAFEKLRKERCEVIVAGSRANGKMWHLPDGPEQEARDEAMNRADHRDKSASRDTQGAENPNPWSRPGFQQWLFGHDVFMETNQKLDSM